MNIDGFTTLDGREIWVDDHVVSDWPERYRFTLAHEVGHLVMHKEIFQLAGFSNTAEWREQVNSISDEQHRWFEYQAYAFAGLVLVPGDALAREAADCVQRTATLGIDLKANWDFAWSTMAASIAPTFEVSTTVIEKRFAKDGIPDRYRQ